VTIRRDHESTRVKQLMAENASLRQQLAGRERREEARRLDEENSSLRQELADKRSASTRSDCTNDEHVALQQRVAELEQWRLALQGSVAMKCELDATNREMAALWAVCKAEAMRPTDVGTAQMPADRKGGHKASGIAPSQPASQAKSEQSKSEQKPEQTVPVEQAVPITYLEAFEAIGGMAKLALYQAISKEIEAKVSNPELDAELKLLLPRDYERRTGFSTKLINQPYVRDLEELYAQANTIYPSFGELIRQLANKTNGEALIPIIKGEVRARMKALFKYMLRAATLPARPA